MWRWTAPGARGALVCAPKGLEEAAVRGMTAEQTLDISQEEKRGRKDTLDTEAGLTERIQAP